MVYPPVDSLSIRARLLSALAAYLGTYQLPNGTTPAIRIDAGIFNIEVDGVPREIPPMKVTGLECVIQPDLGADYTALLGRQSRLTTDTVITLKQWDLTTTVQAAAIALIKALPDILTEVNPRVPRNLTLDTLDQQSFVVTQQQV